MLSQEVFAQLVFQLREMFLRRRPSSFLRRVAAFYYSVQNQFERFRGFLELIGRFEFELRRRENYIF